MNQSYHRFTELFLQLGLPSDVDGIKHFLENHSPLDPSIRLENAPFGRRRNLPCYVMKYSRTQTGPKLLIS